MFLYLFMVVAGHNSRRESRISGVMMTFTVDINGEIVLCYRPVYPSSVLTETTWRSPQSAVRR